MNAGYGGACEAAFAGKPCSYSLVSYAKYVSDAGL